MNYEELSERQVFNLIKNGGMDLDQFFEYMEAAGIQAVERYEEMKAFYDKELASD